MDHLNFLTIHTDGGSRGNPGPAATGIVILDSSGSVIHEFGRFLGVATNNVAEYSAVIDALEYLSTVPSLILREGPPQSREGELISIHFKLDSMLVVEQLSGHWKIKDANLAVLASKVHSLISLLPPLTQISFTYIPRNLNSAADRQVNLTLDQNTKF
jgi:probable phosphoglycerate mutase